MKVIDKTIIMGGGVGGVSLAIELARRGLPSLILEKSPELLNRTSAHTPGRVGLGFHYPGDKGLETARTVIRASLTLKQDFPEALEGPHYSQNGWYCITRNSQDSADQFLKYCNQIKEIYRQEVSAFPSLNYGTPEDFFHILPADKYAHIINPQEISLAIQTREGVLNWDMIKNSMLSQLQNYKSLIHIHTGHAITDIQPISDGFFLTVNINNQEEVWRAPGPIVNATADYRLFLDKKTGYMPLCHWVNRLKLLAQIDLPSELHQQNSIFVARGPFTMFTNHGNGVGFVTYAPVTNYAQQDATEKLPAEWEEMIVRGLSATLEKEIGEKIIAGAAKYIPAIKQAKVKKILPGIVQHAGDADIYDATSRLHQRDQTGIFQYHPNYYSLDTGKLCFAPYYGKILAQRIQENMKIYA